LFSFGIAEFLLQLKLITFTVISWIIQKLNYTKVCSLSLQNTIC